MNKLTIELDKQEGGYLPREEVRGTAGWMLDKSAAALELRLFWFSEGHGTQDVSIVDTQRFDHPAPSDQKTFRFRLPAEPYSFTGKLFTVQWALELVTLPGGQSEKHPFILSPTGEAKRFKNEERRMKDEKIRMKAEG
jgi:hypothetical protein